jgi:hypothetical protein
MFDVLAAPAGLAAGRRLALSAMPDAPVVAERPRTRYIIRRRKEERVPADGLRRRVRRGQRG